MSLILYVYVSLWLFTDVNCRILCLLYVYMCVLSSQMCVCVGMCVYSDISGQVESELPITQVVQVTKWCC